MEEAFKAFGSFGKSSGEGITLSNIDKWLKQAGIIDGKKITTTDTGICFNKLKSKTLDYKQFTTFIENLAKEKQMNVEEFKGKLTKCGAPGVAGTTQAVTAGAVDRLTDTSKYTGTHKERFDETGKGRGAEGRSDAKENTGYVQGYKEKDTYDKKHK